ncbi:MAG: hypothetical protein WBA28_06185 [Microbacteriaceae bacterium]
MGVFPLLCQRCGRPVDELDIFCGECGTLIVHPPKDQETQIPQLPVPPAAPATPVYSPTIPIQRLVPGSNTPFEKVEDFRVADIAEVSHPVVAPAPIISSDAEPQLNPAAVIEQLAAPDMAVAGNEIISEDLEVTRIVRSAHQRGPKFELVFSTGGSFEVSGAGLLGRNPLPAEDEQFEQLVLFRDPNRTVSKTHLEFGVEGTNFWVLDRNSVNGSYLLATDNEELLEECTPGQRYSVMDGGKVGIGDEHFQVRYR